MPAELLRHVRDTLAPDVTVVDRISAGGQGALFRGTRAGIDVAVKVFDEDEDPARVIHEVEALQQIDCAFLVKALQADMIDLPSGEEVPYAIYEYLDGSNLTSMIGTNPDSATLIKIGCEVGTAIEALWAARIIHRDVKPANIMQLADRFVLVDVGFAKHLDRSGVTQPGQRPGTRGYMSPEQAKGQTLSIRADVFALGVTLYELASGVHPFNRVQQRIGRDVPIGLETRRPDLPAKLCRFVNNMMAARPQRRPLRIVSDFKGM